jgi:polysaccharide biosynthesis/export protein
MKLQNYLLYILSALLFASCVSKEKMIYLQGNLDTDKKSLNYDPLIQRDDRLSIIVSSLDFEASKSFNLNQSSANANANVSVGANNVQNTYLVDVDGTIDFPVLGTLSVEGFTINQLKILLKEKLAVYLTNPIVNISIQNFKVTVLGDVNSPGIKTFFNHRVTLLDAIGASNDLTVYGKRYNILVIRDYQGVKSFNRVDITKADFVNSPFYYLDQNDVIYVEQRKSKLDASALPNLPLIFSILSFVTTLVFLVSR